MQEQPSQENSRQMPTEVTKYRNNGLAAVATEQGARSRLHKYPRLNDVINPVFSVQPHGNTLLMEPFPSC